MSVRASRTRGRPERAEDDDAAREPYGVADYAREKGLPATWLREEFGLRDHTNGVEIEIPYYHADGTPAFAKYRGVDSRFRFRKGTTVIPYGLDRLRERGMVLVVEGESDLHVLAYHRVQAVGIPGAANWKSEFAPHLDGHTVIVWREPDAGGDTLVLSLVQDLPDARVVDAPEDAPDPSDLHLLDPEAFRDRLAALLRSRRPIGAVVDELAEGADDAGDTPERATPEQTVIVPPPNRPMPVARDLVKAQYMDDDGVLLLRDFRGDFHRYDGRCWPDVQKRIVRAHAYRYLENAVFLEEGEGGTWPRPWDPTRHKINNTLDALRAVVLLEASAPPVWTDGRQDPPADQLVAMENGLLHIPTRKLHDHTPRFFTHHSLNFPYDPDAPEPERWLAFLRELWEHDPTAIKTLQEVFGYVLGGDTRQQKIFLLVGPKRAGKGTIGRVLTGLLGAHHVAAPTLASFQQNFGLQPLIGKPLALISDARLSGQSRRSVVVERLLSISGEDSLTIDRKYRDPWTGRLPTRLMLLTNELPRLSDSSGALASRFILFVLRKSFYGREDPHLTDKLLAEAPGIFNWSLTGLDRLRERGHFEQPECGREAIRRLEDLSSPVSAFLRERCIVDAEESVEVEHLWKAWRQWCEGENHRPGTKAVFGKDLRAAVPNIDRTQPRGPRGKRVPTYRGVGLKVNPYAGEVASP